MKVFVTGAHGMLGRAVCKRFKEHELLTPSRAELDLESAEKVITYVFDNKPDAVIHLAAKVGGVLGNMNHAADFYIQNIRINTNVLNACHKADVKKTISILSTCVYPNNVIYPLTEEQLHNGEPHESNFAYAYTKRMLHIQSMTYVKQFQQKFVCVIPNNIYGPNDLYGEGSHVIPGLMQRFHEAKIHNEATVEVWGSGKCKREFTYSEDMADYIYNVFDLYDSAFPLNIGNNIEYSIGGLAQCIKTTVGYKGKIIFNADKPEGQIRKPSSIENFKHIMKNSDRAIVRTSLQEGLRKTYEWFEANYPNVRGL